MNDTIDVVEIDNLHDAAPDDLLLDDRGEIVGGVIAGRPGEIRVELDSLPAGSNRWSWDLSKLRTDTNTLPILAKMRVVLEDHGLAYRYFEIVRPA